MKRLLLIILAVALAGAAANADTHYFCFTYPNPPELNFAKIPGPGDHNYLNIVHTIPIDFNSDALTYDGENWWIHVFATCNRTSGNTSRIGISLNYTSNNFSGNSDAAEAEDSTSAANLRGQVSLTYMFKITDTANQKFRFRMSSSSGSGTEFLGDTGKTLTGFSIFKAAEV